MGLPRTSRGPNRPGRDRRPRQDNNVSCRALVRLLHILDVASDPSLWGRHVPVSTPCLLLRRWPQRARSCVPDAASRLLARQTSMCPPGTSRQMFSADQRHMMGRGSLLTCGDIEPNPGPWSAGISHTFGEQQTPASLMQLQSVRALGNIKYNPLATAHVASISAARTRTQFTEWPPVSGSLTNNSPHAGGRASLSSRVAMSRATPNQ